MIISNYKTIIFMTMAIPMNVFPWDQCMAIPMIVFPWDQCMFIYMCVCVCMDCIIWGLGQLMGMAYNRTFFRSSSTESFLYKDKITALS